MQSTTIEPYLFFGGRCEEAIAFYREVLGAETEMMMRWSESPEPPPPGKLKPGYESKIMHASFRIGEARIMASDGSGNEPGFGGFSLALSVATGAEADRAFEALVKGGKVIMSLTKTFWSPRFGMLTDKFGVGWMVSVAAKPT
jgi:PhnB protein